MPIYPRLEKMVKIILFTECTFRTHLILMFCQICTATVLKYFVFCICFSCSGNRETDCSVNGLVPKLSDGEFGKDVSNFLFFLPIKYELNCRKVSLHWYFYTSVSLFSISQLVVLDYLCKHKHTHANQNPHKYTQSFK